MDLTDKPVLRFLHNTLSRALRDGEVLSEDLIDETITYEGVMGALYSLASDKSLDIELWEVCYEARKQSSNDHASGEDLLSRNVYSL